MQNIKIISILLLCMLFAGAILNTSGQQNSTVQTELSGRYIYKGKDGEKPFNFMFNFKTEGIVFYSYEYKGAATKKGKWTFENDVITVVLPAEESSLVFKLKKTADVLEVVEKPKNVLVISVGTVFRNAESKPSAPALSAKEISERLFNFAKSIQTVEDLSPENIERQMGIKVEFNEDDRTNYGFWGKISDSSWTYGLVAYPYPSKDNKTTDTVRFSFDNEREYAEIKPICVELESVRKDLSEAGFSYRNSYGVHSYLRGLSFSRDNLFIEVSVKGTFLDYESIKNNCVESVIISAANVGKK